MEKLQELKLILRENEYPLFSDEELSYYLKRNNFDLNKTAYECLIIKSENESTGLPGGLQLADNSEYWLRLAAMYKPKKRSFIL
ncbi:hypothetical protein UT300013_32870 [Paraclostridium sordellii]|uniref:hypothetical protein n=1 Tax=Paraclostridium sordellii TaxID=1505 RepID=UPI0005DEA286|nr:hypothetical protein [Paeniclostridium sordellii]CEP46431.1 Uncharacterised protein [[Clostridium] sordellii] [Paeniclostridium sordellii]